MVAGFFLTEIIPSISKNLVTTTTLHKIWESTKRKTRRFLNQNSKETKNGKGWSNMQRKQNMTKRKY
jgi:hypothetical protein